MVRPMSAAGSLKRRPWLIGGFWFFTPLVCAIAVSGCASPQAVTAQKSNRPVHANSYKAWHQTLDEMRQKAEQGDQEAQYELGRLYKTGLAGSRDAQEAEKWYRLAAEQGHREAQYSLAALYASGIGIPRDMQRASKWYRLAAEQGHADAQFSLATLYEFGQGVTRDDQQAMEWYRLAAEQGNEMAADALCKWDTTCQSTKWQARQRRRQEQLAREKEHREVEARAQQRKVDEVRMLGERLGTIGVAVLPSYKRIMEKSLDHENWDLPSAEEMPGVTVASGLYGGPLGMIGAVGGVGLAYVFKWISDGVQKGAYHSKEEVRRAKAAMKDALQGTRIAENLQVHTHEQISSNLASKVVSLDQPRDLERIADGKYTKLREHNVDTLIMFDDLRIGLVGSDDTARFVMRTDISVVDVVHKSESHKQTLTYTGDSLELSNWIENDAAAFLSELQKAYDVLAADAVNGLIAALSIPSTEPNATAVANIEQTMTSGLTINCKTRYCGNYYGYLIVKGPSRTKKLPIKITISDGELLAATKTDTASNCLLQGPTTEPIHIGVSNKFEGKYEAVCEIEDMGKCRSTIRLKGRIYEDYENAIELSAISSLRCPSQTYEMKAKASGITTGSSNASFETTNPVEQVETLLRNVGTESVAYPVLSASTEVAR